MPVFSPPRRPHAPPCKSPAYLKTPWSKSTSSPSCAPNPLFDLLREMCLRVACPLRLLQRVGSDDPPAQFSYSSSEMRAHKNKKATANKSRWPLFFLLNL